MSDKPSSNILENFVNLVKSINDPEQAIELIMKIIESPSVYSFSEILEIPLISSVNIHLNKLM
jgi:hypothetical protein